MHGLHKETTQLSLKTMRTLLLGNGCNFAKRLWRGLRDRNGLDEGWEKHYHLESLEGKHVVVDKAIDFEGLLGNAHRM